MLVNHVHAFVIQLVSLRRSAALLTVIIVVPIVCTPVWLSVTTTCTTPPNLVVVSSLTLSGTSKNAPLHVCVCAWNTPHTCGVLLCSVLIQSTFCPCVLPVHVHVCIHVHVHVCIQLMKDDATQGYDHWNARRTWFLFCIASSVSKQ